MADRLRSTLGVTEFDDAFRLGQSISTEAHLVTVRSALRGQSPVTPDRIGLLAKHYRLTRRETEVYRLLPKRLSDRQIADRLFIEKRTAESHVRHILGKLQVENRWEAAALLDEF